jgi:predicted tellurium resistance membrane protein TerC
MENGSRWQGREGGAPASNPLDAWRAGCSLSAPMDWIADPQIWISLVTLTALEIVLGIDNVIFISILSSKLPADQQAKARSLGLSAALVTRILLLFTITWLMGLTRPFFTAFGHGVTGKDVILIVGGLFLIAKSTHEIHGKLEGEEGAGSARVAASLASVIVQIMLLDIVFSLDSVITAVGMANNLGVMVAAVVLAMVVMLLSAGSISAFVNRHPTVKMLALSFLLLIGVVLVADGCGQHISKGYIYFAMAFSVIVELLNLKLRAKQAPITLHQAYK